jgi:hypothetical protein
MSCLYSLCLLSPNVYLYFHHILQSGCYLVGRDLLITVIHNDINNLKFYLGVVKT